MKKNTYAPDNNAHLNIPRELRTKTNVYSRVMGYIREYDNYNIGKKQEARERVNFKEDYKLT